MVLSRRKSIITSLFLSLVLLFSLCAANFVSANEGSSTQGVDYLALGDSLAAGQTPNKGIGDSYTDLLAKKIDQIGFLDSFSKQYAVPGYTTADVLKDIQNDVRKGPNDTLGIKAHIAQAEVITITAGANDLLSKLDRSETGVSIDPAIVPGIMQEIGANLTKILMEIKKVNPTAKIYVMGYYNSFPYLPAEQQAQLLQVMSLLNNTIQQVTVGAQAIFVPTADVIAKNYKVFLPNPLDVHLSVPGYETVSNEFWKVIVLYLSGDHKNSVFVNKNYQTFQQNPILVNDTTLVHVRGVFDDLGANVKWDNTTRSVIIEKGTDSIKIQVDSKRAFKNGKEIKLSASARIVNDRLMIPVRFVSESLGAKVQWDAQTNNIFIVGE